MSIKGSLPMTGCLTKDFSRCWSEEEEEGRDVIGTFLLGNKTACGAKISKDLMRSMAMASEELSFTQMLQLL
jgi:hypothetical protein